MYEEQIGEYGIIMSRDRLKFSFFFTVFFGTGAHCERCADGYYGDPRNGGKCAG